MEVLRRTHLPHLLEVTLVAALLALVITVLVVSTIGPSGPSASRLPSSFRGATATSLHSTARWLADPFAPLSSSPSPWRRPPR